MWEYLDEKLASPFSTLKIPSIIDDCHRQRKIIKKIEGPRLTED